MRLLSVDWDFFFPTPSHDDPDRYFLFDWGHRDAPFYMSPALWANRASGFVANDRPLPPLSGEQDTFWSRFTFSKGAKLYLAESHASAARPAIVRGVSEVWSFDAHHDLGYDREAVDHARRGRYACDTWGLLYTEAAEVPVSVVYPAWKKHAFEDEPGHLAGGLATRRLDDPALSLPTFDRVFLCRSGAWVPTWHDDAFTAFAQGCPIPPGRRRDVSHYPLTPRGYDHDEVRTRAEWLRGPVTLGHGRATW